ncbi:MAG: ABC transporter permease [Candidatus Hydrogenedentes bacterium]|nr:ABC transporter permease [Candidatus Hydrogenedentota bacterium]
MHPSTWRIAWRNLGRNKRRTGLALLAIAVGQFALLATNGIMRGYVDNIRLAITGPMVGHVQVHAPEWREERALDLVISNVDEAAAAIRQDPAVLNAGARIYAPVLVAPEQDAYAAVVVGVDADVESQEFGLLSGLDAPLEDGAVLIGYLLARRIGAEPGQEIAVVGQGADGSIANDLYTIRDIIKSPADIVNQTGIVMTMADAQYLLVMPGQAHEIVVRTTESGQAEALAARLAELPALAGTEVVDWKQIVPEIVLILDMVDYVGYFVLVLVLIAAVAGIANTLMMSTFERMHEFGMLLALGSRPSRIVHMIMIEAVLIGLLGVLVGTFLGYGFEFVTSGTGIDMASWGGSGAEVEDLAFKGLNLPLHIFPRLEYSDSVLGLVAVTITSLLAAIWPATIAGRLEPMEAMRA